MSKMLWKTLVLGPAVLGASLLVAGSALAAQTPATEKGLDQLIATTEDQPMASLETSEQNTQTPVQEIAAVTETSAATAPEEAQTPEISAPSQEVSPTVNVADTPQLAQMPEANTPVAQETTEVLQQVNQYNSETENSDAMDQVTNVSQLSDVRPTDWAYEALRSLVERYGCIAGYPDGTYRGNRALSRYEFAAGLNACLTQIEKLIAASSADFVTKEDLATLQKLVDEFSAELATLRTRVDNLEGRVRFLEDHQFSTTTKLVGEVIFAGADVFNEDFAEDSGTPSVDDDLDLNTIFADRVRLNLDSSFTGKDRLRVRLEAANITSFNDGLTGTNMTRLAFDTDNNNDVQIDELYYRFPIGKNLTVQVDAANAEFNDAPIPVVNPLFESSGTGSISRFGRFSPIYRAGNATGGGGGAGVSFNYKFSDALSLSGGYLARRSNDPGEGRGIADGTYAALGQLTFSPIKALTLAATYSHGYYSGNDVNITGGTGSSYAGRPFGALASSANYYGLEANFRLNPRIQIGGWAGYTEAILEDGAGSPLTTGDSAEIWNWAVNLGITDLGKKGNLLGFVFGMPPKVTNNDNNAREDDDTSFHIEGFFRYRLTNNIDITPGLIVITNPEHNDNNETLYVGTIRTTFRF